MDIYNLAHLYTNNDNNAQKKPLRDEYRIQHSQEVLLTLNILCCAEI